jgi:hypothetical protein
MRALQLQDSARVLHRNFVAVLAVQHPFRRLEQAAALADASCALGINELTGHPARLAGRGCMKAGSAPGHAEVFPDSRIDLTLPAASPALRSLS